MPDKRDLHGADTSTPPAVVVDPEVMGGWPVFVGTRVPASMVVGMVDSGASWAELVAYYPFLTEAHVAAASAYLAAPENADKGPTNWLGLPSRGRGLKVVRQAPGAAKPSSDS